MIGIEKQVTGRELSEALKKAGYPQKGLWWWVHNYGQGNNLDTAYWTIRQDDDSTCGWRGNKSQLGIHACIVAPTFTEVWDKLPICIEKDGIVYDLIMLKTVGKTKRTVIIYRNNLLNKLVNAYGDENPAGSVSKMWLYLKEKNLL